MIFRIAHSRYVVGWGKAEYRHHFDVTLTDATGAVVLEKTFERFDTKLPLSDTYNFFTYFNYPNDCKFKVCEFRHGEIDFMEVLRAGFNSDIYKEFI